MADAVLEIENGERFAFGENWSRFLENMDEDRLAGAEISLRRMLEVDDLKGKRFLDIGSGSGLFSLAARRLGADVESFDFDPQSVACAEGLRDRYFREDPGWVIGQGSVLDTGFIDRLESADIVYAWGVLHHTGAMWQALENAGRKVRPGGRLFISIYNDQGEASIRWRWIKKIYNRYKMLRPVILWACLVRLWVPSAVRGVMNGKLFKLWGQYKTKSRGMSPWFDAVDWVGGWPFEYAKPEEIFDFYRKRGFTLTRLVTCGGKLGCNEFVFMKN